LKTTTAINLTDKTATAGPANVFSKLPDTRADAAEFGNRHGREKFLE